MRRKVIIDTDCGVDDAMAIGMALVAHKRKEIEIAAITAVNGNGPIENVLINVLRTLDLFGLPDIPVYKGAGEALVIKYPDGPHYHGSDGFNDVVFNSKPDRNRIQKEQAIDAIHRLINMYPGEVNIVALGPLTNIAIAFKAYPELPSLINEMFIMGGNFEGIGNTSIAAEFNFHADPEAAYIVLHKTECDTYLITCELCLKYFVMDMDWRNNKLGKIDAPQAKFFNELEEIWFEVSEYITQGKYIMYDQLCMAVFLDTKSTVKKSEKHLASVELSGHYTRGQCIIEQRIDKKGYKHNIIIVKDLVKEPVEKLVFRTFGHNV